jgi:hypothetical protein
MTSAMHGAWKKCAAFNAPSELARVFEATGDLLYWEQFVELLGKNISHVSKSFE